MFRNPYSFLETEEKWPTRSSLRRFTSLFLLLITFSLAYFLFYGVDFDFSDGATVEEELEDIETSLPEYLENRSVSPIFEAFYDCVHPKLAVVGGSYDEMWYSFVNLTTLCDGLGAYKAFDMRTVKNHNETRYIAYPRKDEDLTLVAFGIAQDVSLEMKLKEMYPRFEFFGVDRSAYKNKELYEEKLEGKYFRYGSDGMLSSSDIRKIGNRKNKTKTIGVDVLFADKIRKQRIDVVWLNLERNEYSILKQIHSNGALDKKGVKICQMNVVMHNDISSGDAQKFHDFVWKILEDKRYIILKPMFIRYKEKTSIRIFLANVADKECTDLFLS